MPQGTFTHFLKSLFVDGAYINWFAPLAIAFYGIVSLGCLNSAILVKLYLAAISPSTGTIIRIGYFGICISTPTVANWTCSRFIKGDHGLDDSHVKLIKAVKKMQYGAMYPLPAGAAILLFIIFVSFLVFRNRPGKKAGYAIVAAWVSVAIGFAGALNPMMLGQALGYAAPVYGSQVSMKISLGNVVLTWMAFAAHLVWVLLAVWWQKKRGGGGGGGGGDYGMDEEEGKMEYEQQEPPYPTGY
ncbi:hypothetical protein HBH46_114960 [Parastagonospora nodorum]|nr:hypothetical protein HBH46_114960 [Parastagonospora nodorum]